MYRKLSVVALVGVMMATGVAAFMPSQAHAAPQPSILTEGRLLAQANPANPGGDTGQTAAQDNASPTLSCEILSANPINWFVCPVVTALQASVNAMNGAIDAMLTINTKQLFDDRIKTAWAQFRLLAIGLIIIAGLVMIGSQAFGMELLDAYTVRKVLPRLVVAIIFISISWDFLKFMIDLSNDAGNSIRAIIYQPFQDLPGAASQGLKLGGWTTFIGLLVGGAAIVTLGIAALLSFLVTAALAVGVGFIILLLRQLIIMLLVIVAPIAIALYILPNTQKAFEFWKNTFISMLVVFPIISAFIALGRVFAVLSYNNSGGTDPTVLDQLSAFISFFLPYFLLPFAFKLAGGMIGTVAGIVNDKGKGAFDGLSNYRSGKRTENIAGMKAGNRFADRNPLARGFNRATVGAATGVKGRFGMGVRGAQAVDQVRRNASADLMKTPGFAAIQNDDNALMAATYRSAGEAQSGMRSRLRAQYQEKVDSGDWSASKADAEATTEANRSVRSAQASIGFGRSQAIAAAQQLSSTGTGYQAIGNKTALEDVATTVARASGGDKSTAASIAGFINSDTKRQGRNDLAPGFGKLNGLVQGQISGGSSTPSHTDYVKATVEAARGTDNATLIRNKTPGVKNMARALNEGLHLAQSEGRTADAAEIAFKIQNIQDSSMYGPETNTAAVAQHVVSQGTKQVIKQVTTVVQNQAQERVVRDVGYARDQNTGDILQNPLTGERVVIRDQVPNAAYSPTAERVAAQRTRSRFNPDDPNNAA